MSQVPTHCLWLRQYEEASDTQYPGRCQSEITHLQGRERTRRHCSASWSLPAKDLHTSPEGCMSGIGTLMLLSIAMLLSSAVIASRESAQHQHDDLHIETERAHAVSADAVGLQAVSVLTANADCPHQHLQICDNGAPGQTQMSRASHDGTSPDQHRSGWQAVVQLHIAKRGPKGKPSRGIASPGTGLYGEVWRHSS